MYSEMMDIKKEFLVYFYIPAIGKADI